MLASCSSCKVQSSCLLYLYLFFPLINSFQTSITAWSKEQPTFDSLILAPGSSWKVKSSCFLSLCLMFEPVFSCQKVLELDKKSSLPLILYCLLLLAAGRSGAAVSSVSSCQAALKKDSLPLIVSCLLLVAAGRSGVAVPSPSVSFSSSSSLLRGRFRPINEYKWEVWWL